MPRTFTTGKGEMLKTYARCGELVLVAAMILLGACKREERAEVTAKTEATLDTARAKIGQGVDTLAARVSGPEYSNAELVGLLDAVNDAEIEVGGMAQSKATDPQVRDFAQRIVTDHRALKAAVSDSARAHQITPTPPGPDNELRQDHQKGMSDLAARAKGKEFDEAFVEHEIDMHRKALDRVEDALGRAQNQELHGVLEQARAGLQAHLQMAQELEKKFGV